MSPLVPAMRLLVLLLCLAPTFALAQSQRSGVRSLPALHLQESVQLSEAQQRAVSRDRGLRAMLDVTGSTASARRGHALYASGPECSARGVVCLIVTGAIQTITVPPRFASEGGLGGTRTLVPIERVTLDDGLAEVIAEDPELRDALRGDGDGGFTAGEGYRLITTHPDLDDCSDPRVQCGVVFEVETTLRIILIGE